jgi:hypothetical protein
MHLDDTVPSSKNYLDCTAPSSMKFVDGTSKKGREGEGRAGGALEEVGG